MPRFKTTACSGVDDEARNAPAAEAAEDGLSYDCTDCGACCRSFPIFASTADAAREPRIRREARQLPGHLADGEKAYQLHPLPFLESCCFLQPDLLCSIYPTRPEVCRHFEPGSPQCREARRRQGVGDL